MGNRSARPDKGRRNGPTANTGRTKMALWGAGILVLVVVAHLAARDEGVAHPTPREMDHSGHVVHHTRYQGYPRVAEVYRQAAEIPHVLDGLYCYCACSEHSGHYSLLDCFASDHGAACDVCLSEATLAHRMTRDGASLDEIRDAIDRLYGT